MIQDKRAPFSFSFSKRMIEKLKYYRNTNPDISLSQDVEKYLDVIIPDMVPDCIEK